MISLAILDCLKSFSLLLYPDTCCACGATLVSGEEHLCSHCLTGLPRTGFHLYKENQLTKVFWGRVSLETGTALYYYQKGSRVQKLIQNFKYRGNQALGHYLGFLLGQELRSSAFYAGLDCIIPVPLHPAKERSRGYNQSNVIAGGISGVLDIPYSTNLLIRRQATSTQTRKSRFSRWENVSSVFQTPDREFLCHKNILLVDDVVTTGSTLEACAQKLVEISGVRVWAAAVAFTV